MWLEQFFNTFRHEDFRKMPELNEYILQILKAQQEQQMAFQEHQQEQLIVW